MQATARCNFFELGGIVHCGDVHASHAANFTRLLVLFCCPFNSEALSAAKRWPSRPEGFEESDMPWERGNKSDGAIVGSSVC